MTSFSDTLLVEEEGVNMDGVGRDGAEWEGGVADSCRDLNCASLRFTVAASVAQIWEKWSDIGKGVEK